MPAKKYSTIYEDLKRKIEKLEPENEFLSKEVTNKNKKIEDLTDVEKNAYILVTRDKKLKAHGTFHPVSTKIMNLYNELVVSEEAVEEIKEDSTGKKDKKTLINLKTKEGKIHTFYKDEFSFAEKFLGEDVEYSISNTDVFTEGSVCLVKSKKGTGFFLGIREL